MNKYIIIGIICGIVLAGFLLFPLDKKSGNEAAPSDNPAVPVAESRQDAK